MSKLYIENKKQKIKKERERESSKSLSMNCGCWKDIWFVGVNLLTSAVLKL